MKKLLAFILIFTVLLSCSSCESETPYNIVHVTDLHFAGREYHDYEGFFFETNDNNGSGKQMLYLDDIVDAFVEEMKELKPDCIVITGDTSFTGARVSHQLLKDKLQVLRDSGITVLILPGNHDIVKYSFTYLDGEYQQTDVVPKEEYPEFYADFGYGEAISKDNSSLSYVYDTGKGIRIFMLDTMIVHGVVYGQLNIGTMQWLERELKACVEAGDSPIVAGHHNLLEHNPRFNMSYRLGNFDDVEELLTKYGCSLYLSGHLHTQHIVQNENITDIVGGAFAVYPHRYGVIEYYPDRWDYESRSTDVANYAESIGSTDENLLNYDEYGYNFFYRNAYNQGYDILSTVITDKELLEKYADFTARVNVAYFGGDFSEVDLSIGEDFMRDSVGCRWNSYMGYILETAKDCLTCSYPVKGE